MEVIFGDAHGNCKWKKEMIRERWLARACVCACVCVRARACVCVCKGGRKKERETVLVLHQLQKYSGAKYVCVTQVMKKKVLKMMTNFMNFLINVWWWLDTTWCCAWFVERAVLSFRSALTPERMPCVEDWLDLFAERALSSLLHRAKEKQ